MLAKIRQAVRNENGFTLIELLMVIVILGILSGIVVFAVGGITDKGQTSACKATITTVETAEEAYYAQNDEYAALADLVPSFLHSVPATASATVSADGKSVSVVGTGDCAGITA
jgi:general secretion pathway protein G